MKPKNYILPVALVVAGGAVVAIIAYNSASNQLQNGPTQAQVHEIQNEMKAQVPAGLAPIPKEQAEAGVQMRGPSQKKK